METADAKLSQLLRESSPNERNEASRPFWQDLRLVVRSKLRVLLAIMLRDERRPCVGLSKLLALVVCTMERDERRPWTGLRGCSLSSAVVLDIFISCLFIDATILILLCQMIESGRKGGYSLVDVEQNGGRVNSARRHDRAFCK